MSPFEGVAVFLARSVKKEAFTGKRLSKPSRTPGVTETHYGVSR